MNTIKLNTIGEVFAKSGGQQGGGGFRYFSTQGLEEIWGAPAIDTIAVMLPVVTVKSMQDGVISIIPMDVARTQLTVAVLTAENIVAVSVADTKMYVSSEWQTTEEALASLAETVVLTEITEEEFYNLEA